MAAYFNLTNNEISKELLVNKFSMILENQCKHVVNDPKFILPRKEPQTFSVFFKSSVWRCSRRKGVLKDFQNFGKKISVSKFHLDNVAGFRTYNFIQKRHQYLFSLLSPHSS